jgi:hypothetical protein
MDKTLKQAPGGMPLPAAWVRVVPPDHPAVTHNSRGTTPARAPLRRGYLPTSPTATHPVLITLVVLASVSATAVLGLLLMPNSGRREAPVSAVQNWSPSGQGASAGPVSGALRPSSNRSPAGPAATRFWGRRPLALDALGQIPVDDALAGYGFSTKAFGLTGAARANSDQVIGLRAAWRSGAAHWATSQRQAFAIDPLNRMAATEGSPGSHRYRCRRAARDVALRLSYELSATPAQLKGLQQVLSTCPTTTLPSAG